MICRWIVDGDAPPLRPSAARAPGAALEHHHAEQPHVDDAEQRHLAPREARLARSDGAGPFEPMDDRPLLACVWELEVIAEERAAFVAHMMGARPDRTGWLRA